MNGKDFLLIRMKEALLASQFSQTDLFLGIDAGGTRCRARLINSAGDLLGEAITGSANLSTNFDGAVAELISAAEIACGDVVAIGQVRAVIGIAGANVPALRERLEEAALPFAAFAVRSDAETACLGAHGGEDGGILILGTGSQGVILKDGEVKTVGGWGFALSDTGSGAVLGHTALRRALLAHEGIEPGSALTEALMARFDHDPSRMLAFALSAIPAHWAECCPLVFEAAANGDPVGEELITIHIRQVEKLLARMCELGAAKVVLMGGLATPTGPLVSPTFQSFLTEAAGDALDGALALSRRLWT